MQSWSVPGGFCDEMKVPTLQLVFYGIIKEIP